MRVVDDPLLVLDELREAISNLPDEAFKSAGNSPPHRRQALLNKVDAVASLVAAELFGEALAKLREDLVPKWDGCAGRHAGSSTAWPKGDSTRSATVSPAAWMYWQAGEPAFRDGELRGSPR